MKISKAAVTVALWLCSCAAITGCSATDAPSMAEPPAQQDALPIEVDFDAYTEWKVMDKGRYYCTLDGFDEPQRITLVTNDRYEVVYTHTGTNVSIHEGEDGILLIEDYRGPGSYKNQYYDPEKDVFSTIFEGCAVIAEENGLIAYLNWSIDGAERKNWLIIQDVFEKERFYVAYAHNILDMEIPNDAVAEAAFLDENTLTLTFYAGDYAQDKMMKEYDIVTKSILFRDVATGRARPRAWEEAEGTMHESATERKQ